MKIEDEYVIMGEGLEEEEYQEDEYIEGASLIDASVGGRESEQMEEETPPVSSRRDTNPRVGVPKLQFGIGNNLNLDGKAGQEQIQQNSGSLGSERENDSKPKKVIPNLGLRGISNFGNAQPKMDLNLNSQAIHGARGSLSQDKSDDDLPKSSGRTSESQDSRRRSDKRGTHREQPVMSLPLEIIPQGKLFVNNYEDLRSQVIFLINKMTYFH